MKQIKIEEIGQQMIDMVRMAIKIIQDTSHEMLVEDKIHYDGVKDDCVTNADRAAQEMYIREITGRFPTFGVLAEEKELTIPCTEIGKDIYFTVDPLDGTKAFSRKQSHGVGTMIALVEDGQVIAAFIGDINTGEIYGFAGFEKVGPAIRYRFGKETQLEPDIVRPLGAQYLSLREAPWTFPNLIQKVMRVPAEGGLFKNIEVSGGSIATHVARIWKGEVGGLVLEPGYKTPWDEAPPLGILKRLGFVFYRIDVEAPENVYEYNPELNKEVLKHDYYMIIIHNKHQQEFGAWLQNQKQ